jgi:hypothetical protein
MVTVSSHAITSCLAHANEAIHSIWVFTRKVSNLPFGGPRVNSPQSRPQLLYLAKGGSQQHPRSDWWSAPWRLVVVSNNNDS